MWNPNESIKDKFSNTYFSCRRNEKGGGVAVIPNCNFLEMSYFPSPCTDILIAKAICYSQILLWLIVAYIPPEKQSNYCSLILYLLDTFIPMSDWPRCIILGDFNMNLKKPNRLLKQFTQKLKEKDINILDPFIINHSRPKSGTLIDYWFHGTSIKIPPELVFKYDTALSDHSLISFTLQLEKPSKLSKIYLPNKKLATHLSESALSSSRDADGFLIKLNDLYNRNLKRFYSRCRVKRPKGYQDYFSLFLDKDI